MGRLNDFSLYVITGENYHPGRSMLAVMEEALKGGADIVQLRDKASSPADLLEKAHQLRALTRRFGVPFIVNDHIELVQAVEADGVHLGQEDMPLHEARSLLGEQRIIGISTHAIEEARAAEQGGADYIGVGPIYPTGTKPGVKPVTLAYVKQVAAEIRIPFVAIGGITETNAGQVLDAGARRLCAVSAVVGSQETKAVCERLNAWIRAARGIGYEALEVTVNGHKERVFARTIGELVASYGMHGRRLVIELEGSIVAAEDWPVTPIRPGMSIELLHFVGGG